MLDEHLRCEFELRDADATMRTMVDDPYLEHVPTMTGGVGWDEVHRFYRDFWLPSWAGGRVAHEHFYWDQGSLLVQVGLLDHVACR